MKNNRSYLLVLLLLILAFNFVDRLALGLLLQDIKVDLSLSDTQLGLLSGIAFALFYSIMGIPIARWADRGNRITIIAITTALWSVAVAFCGVAGTFLQLLAMRVGVAIGEAGCIPPAHSLIADYYARDERPRAVAIYMLGAPLSFVIGFFVAGWLNELYGWRATFMLLGAPGLCLAALSWLTLREPRSFRSECIKNGEAQTACPTDVETPSLKAVMLTLWGNATFRNLLMCISVAYFFGYGILQWQPTFFVRSFGLNTRELGAWFAVIYGVAGFVGTYLGGELASRMSARDERRQLRGAAAMYCGCGAVSACVYLSSDYRLAFAFLALSTFMAYLVIGPMFATIQTLVPDRMRAISIAVVYLFANLIGMGLGPVATGALSDTLRSAVGEESLRYSLLVLCPGYFWAAWHLWRGSNTVARDLRAVSAGTRRTNRDDSEFVMMSVTRSSITSKDRNVTDLK